MNPLKLFFSATGRIAPRAFALGVVIVYALSFLSQVLISPTVATRWSVGPFALAQLALTWAWFALHAKRLRDAGEAAGPALAIAALYALAIVLLILLVEPVIGPDVGGAAPPRFGFGDLWVILLLAGALAGQGTADFFYFLALGMLVLILAPVAIAIGFSIWTGSRPATDPAP